MAVIKSYWGEGLGSQLMVELERIAKENKVMNIFLNSRDTAVGFYEKHNYQIVNKAEPLFGKIIHYRMEKKLNN